MPPCPQGPEWAAPVSEGLAAGKPSRILAAFLLLFQSTSATAAEIWLSGVSPGVQIGDVEPIGTAQPPDWVQQITEWTHVYRKVTGTRLAFFHADVAWTAPIWRQQFAAVKSRMQADGIKFGVIYDGGGTGKQESDELWTQEAEQRFRMVESDPSLIPEHAVFQSWARWPHNMLPETQPGTMTNLVLRYLGTRTVP